MKALVDDNVTSCMSVFAANFGKNMLPFPTDADLSAIFGLLAPAAEVVANKIELDATAYAASKGWRMLHKNPQRSYDAMLSRARLVGRATLALSAGIATISAERTTWKVATSGGCR